MQLIFEIDSRFRRGLWTYKNTYLQKGQALDKAGGYNAEDCSEKVFIDYVKGSRTNVVGLPVEKLVKMLDNLGIEVEDYGM